jgi:Protein of unknown function (DUF3592)
MRTANRRKCGTNERCMDGNPDGSKFKRLRLIAKWFGIIVCQWLLSILMLALLVLSLWNWFDYWGTAGWVRIEGTLSSLKISNYDGSIPGTNWSGDGELSCRYSYVFAGTPYSGTRIGVETFDDSSPRAIRYKKLKQIFDDGKTVSVLVNPAAPAQSALFRETLSGMYFGVGIGLFWFVAIFIMIRRISLKPFP